jgi:hypothetical protein
MFGVPGTPRFRRITFSPLALCPNRSHPSRMRGSICRGGSSPHLLLLCFAGLGLLPHQSRAQQQSKPPPSLVCEGGTCPKGIATAEALRSTSLLWPTAIYSGSVIAEPDGLAEKAAAAAAATSTEADADSSPLPLLTFGRHSRDAEALEAFRKKVMSAAKIGTESPCGHGGLNVAEDFLGRSQGAGAEAGAGVGFEGIHLSIPPSKRPALGIS